MCASTVVLLILSGAVSSVAVYLLGTLATALITSAQARTAAAVPLWWLVKNLWWLVQQIAGHPRITMSMVVLVAWCWLLGWESTPAAVFGLVIAGLVGDDRDGGAS
jgi:S-DNA-T family DNA segregation ATPase FtsK/SpoIIIE